MGLHSHLDLILIHLSQNYYHLQSFFSILSNQILFLLPRDAILQPQDIDSPHRQLFFFS
jgi:hypothetical protein